MGTIDWNADRVERKEKCDRVNRRMVEVESEMNLNVKQCFTFCHGLGKLKQNVKNEDST